jgi:hypothetical protein
MSCKSLSLRWLGVPVAPEGGKPWRQGEGSSGMKSLGGKGLRQLVNVEP